MGCLHMPLIGFVVKLWTLVPTKNLNDTKVLKTLCAKGDTSLGGTFITMRLIKVVPFFVEIFKKEHKHSTSHGMRHK